MVIFNGEGKREIAGPAAESYERAQAAAGAHLIFLCILVNYCVLLLPNVYEGQSASGVNEQRECTQTYLD